MLRCGVREGEADWATGRRWSGRTVVRTRHADRKSKWFVSSLATAGSLDCGMLQGHRQRQQEGRQTARHSRPTEQRRANSASALSNSACAKRQRATSLLSPDRRDRGVREQRPAGRGQRAASHVGVGGVAVGERRQTGRGRHAVRSVRTLTHSLHEGDKPQNKRTNERRTEREGPRRHARRRRSRCRRAATDSEVV